MLRETYIYMNVTHPCLLRTYGMYWLKSLQSDREGVPASLTEKLNEHISMEAQKEQDAEDIYNCSPYIITERMSPSLSDTIHLPSLHNELKEVSIFLNIARALNHLHETGVVRHDVKPANTLLRVVDGNVIGRAKLADFGVSGRVYLRCQQEGTQRLSAGQ